MDLTEEEVARRGGATRQRVRQLVALGIIVPGPDPEKPFRGGDALRVQLVGELERFGVPPTSVAEAISRRALTLSYLDRFPGPSSRTDKTYAALCDELGIPFDLLDRIYVGFGLARPRADEQVREDDLGILSDLPILFSAGLGEDEILRAARVWGEGPRRVAQHQVHSFHELIEEPFRRQGLSDDQALDAALTQVGVQIIPYCARLMSWLYRRHFETYSTQHRLGHIETALESAGLHRKPDAHPEACAFADLSGYSSLTEQLGDTAASRMALQLAELMQEVASQHSGRVVKLIGDAAHFHFSRPSDAVLGAMAFVEAAEPRGLPPAHVGVDAGPMIYTDGDYYGLTVIIAARIASKASPGEVLVGETVAVTGHTEGVRFEKLGDIPLKGIARPVPLYRAVREAARSSVIRAR